MSRIRFLPLVAFFLGLAGLEIFHGLFRLETLREARRKDLIDQVESSQATLVRSLRQRLEGGKLHAEFLARTEIVHAFVAGDESAGVKTDLDRLFLPYLASFDGIDRVRIVDSGGIERLRCERMGGGVAALGRDQLDPVPDLEVIRLAQGLRPGEVRLSPLVVDAGRVEVSARDRRVMHHVTPVEAAERRAFLVVTAYAEPLFDALRSFAPFPGVYARLEDGAGRDLDLAAEGEPPRITGEIFAEHTLALTEEPAMRIRAIVPRRAESTALEGISTEIGWVIAGTAGISILLALAAVFSVRQGLRAFRLHETEAFLARIRRESEKYRALLDSAADLVLVVDPRDGSLREINATARDRLCRPLPERIASIFAPAGEGRLLQALAELEADPEKARAPGEVRVRTQDGELSCDARLALVRLEGESLAQVSLRDLSERKAMERQLRIAERLTSLGLLTAGVAHEINNPLEGIGNYLSLMDRPELADEKRHAYVVKLRHGFERIREIVQQLLRFARPDVAGRHALLADVVARALDLVRLAKDFKEVEVETVGVGEGLAFHGDAGRIEQVVVNLLLNAARAMKGRGRIVVTGRRLQTPSGPQIEILVEDEGPGFEGSDADRIFDPFFSRSGGTGLGLAVSYGTVRAHGGEIAAENRAEGGARLIVRLPAAKGNAAS